jgi:signal transduction histidine kinase
MKRKMNALSRRYGTALQMHLRRSRFRRAKRDVKGAEALGREAVALGLETLDVARIHEQALVILDGRITKGGSSEGRGAARRKQANAFFAEAINPIEQTHAAARQSRNQSSQLNETLRRRTEQLAASNRRLKQKIAGRKTAEEALKQSGEHQKTLLKESVRLQQRLQRLTHRMLVAQESERNKISQGLRDEIVQTLLGINVRMLALQAGATADITGLQKEIASTQELVASSGKIMRRVTRGFGNGS